MQIIKSYDDLKRLRPPPHVIGVVEHELDTLMVLSGGKSVDPANGWVVLFEGDENDSVIRGHFGCEFDALGFDGVVKKSECYVGYVLRDNQLVIALVMPVEALPDTWRAKLQGELVGGA